MPLDRLIFFGMVAALLAVDLIVLQRGRGAESPRRAWLWTMALAAIALGYAAWIGQASGKQPAVEFVTGYLIEFSLSVDNLFIFLLLFRALQMDSVQQRRVLLWGVLGAIAMRGLLILGGATLLDRFGWVKYAFGAILAVAAVRLLLQKPGQETVKGPVAWVQRCCLQYAGGRRLALGSLLLVIAAVEATDLMFAVDSIPAVLAVTRDPWIAFTSNIFAVLGLRSLYFALASMLDSFRLLHYGLGCILGFVAFKMLAAGWVEISALWSLAVILAILAVFLVLSRVIPARERAAG
jgi:tellurite resistance protein TerC